MNKLITDIAAKLFDISENRLLVAFDNDGFLLRQDVRYALGHVSGRNIVDEMAENEYHVQLNKGIYIIRITETQNKESIFKYVMP